MKKETFASREWREICIRKIERKRCKSIKRRGKRPGKSPAKAKRVDIICPEVFSLTSNFEGVVDLLAKIRNQSESGRARNERVYVDFRGIKSLSPGAALALAAEIYRWNNLSRATRGRLQAVDLNEWDPQVRGRLSDMGFFDLLAVSSQPPAAKTEAIRYLKFRHGNKADGESIDKLRTQDLEPVIGEIPGRHYLYTAVTEAMINVVQHAYPNQESNWWLSASYDTEANEVTIMLYDQGVGIPKTLRRKFSERIKNIAEGHHAELIEAAHSLQRSASNESFRGHGLQSDVRGYLEKLPNRSVYRVVSLKGEYIFEKQINGSDNFRKLNHQRPLNGTLIEWRVFLS